MNQMEIIQPCTDWDEYLLSDIARTTSGGTPDRSKKEFYQGTIPWVKSGELNDSFLDRTEEHISEEGLKKSSAKLFPAGALLMAMYGATVGKTAILKIEASTNQAICGILPDETKANTEFLRYQLIFFRKKLLSERYGGAQPNISQTIIKNIRLRLPLLPEQLRIAHVLTTIQTAIEQQARQITLTRELKSALMHKLFTEGLRGENQKETEIGLVPQTWEIISVRDLGEVITGRTPSTKHSEYYDGEYRLISPADLDLGKYVRSAHRTLTKEGFEQCRDLPKETVLVGCIGNIGKIGMTADNKCATNQQINSVICNASFNPHFVYYCLQFSRTRLENIAAKVTVPIVNKSNFEDFKIASPKKSQQDEIAEVLTAVDGKVEILEKKKQTLEELFRTLLHQLMTGQIRVNEIDLPGLS